MTADVVNLATGGPSVANGTGASGPDSSAASRVTHGRVVVRLLGGLGNQLFQYAAGRALAEASDRRLVFDHALLMKDSLRSPALGRWGVETIAGEPTFAAQMALRMPGIWRLLRGTGGRLRIGDTLLLFDTMRGEPIVDDPSARDVVLTGYWQRRACFAPIEPALRRTLALVEAPGLVQRTADLALDERTIAVHVRRGDYTTAAIAAMTPPLPPTYHVAAVEALRRRRAFDRAVVFTDDIAWTEANLRLEIPWRIGSATTQSADADLWLMSRAGGIAIANSSFSWWAAWLAEGHGGIVVAPQRWFGPRGDGYVHPAPDSWERVGWSP